MFVYRIYYLVGGVATYINIVLLVYNNNNNIFSTAYTYIYINIIYIYYKDRKNKRRCCISIIIRVDAYIQDENNRISDGSPNEFTNIITDAVFGFRPSSRSVKYVRPYNINDRVVCRRHRRSLLLAII